MILVYIILILLGYFLGLISCLLQVIRIENRENKKITQILPSMTPLTPFEERCAKEYGKETFVPIKNKINNKIKKEIEKKIKKPKKY